MPKFKESDGFKMKGPEFFKSALKMYGKSPAKHAVTSGAKDEYGESINPRKTLHTEVVDGHAHKEKTPMDKYSIKKGSHKHPHKKATHG